MRSLRSHADASLPASRPRTCRSTLAGWRLAGPDEGTWARHIASVSRYEDRYDPKDRDRLICCSAASASLPYLAPDLDESRETASSTGENAVHPKQPQVLASQRLACVVAGVVEMAEYEFDSHALPPNFPSENPTRSPPPGCPLPDCCQKSARAQARPATGSLRSWPTAPGACRASSWSGRHGPPAPGSLSPSRPASRAASRGCGGGCGADRSPPGRPPLGALGPTRESIAVGRAAVVAVEHARPVHVPVCFQRRVEPPCRRMRPDA